MASQKKKVTLYFNAAMLAETQKEALRRRGLAGRDHTAASGPRRHPPRLNPVRTASDAAPAAQRQPAAGA
jgi:hypothetical protein